MTRTLLSIVLGTTLLAAGVADAARTDEVQAPRTEEVQAPRGEEVQAPRGGEVRGPRELSIAE